MDFIKQAKIICCIAFAAVMLSRIDAVSQEYIWLHVDGKYIRTSDTANPPNAIWQGAGCAWSHLWYRDNTVFNTGAAWLKSKGLNMVQDNFSTLPYPYGSEGGTGKFSIAYNLSDWMRPSVDALKAQKIYANLCNKIGLGSNWTDSVYATWKDHWGKIANEFKNEPWVLGYELFNEPNEPEFSAATPVSAAKVRNKAMECIAVIRQFDTRHIINVGTDFWTQLWRIEAVWGPVNYRPDPTGDQIMFAFHHYPSKWAERGGYAENLAEFSRIKDTYNICISNTEFGIQEPLAPNRGNDAYGKPIPDPVTTWWWTWIPDLSYSYGGYHVHNEAHLKQYENEIMEACSRLKIPWTIWNVFGGYEYNDIMTNKTEDYYRECWIDGPYGVRNVASAIPVEEA